MSDPPAAASPAPGLCGVCRHARAVVSAKGSTFRLCQRSIREPAFPRYPTLPVLACPGFEPVAGAIEPVRFRNVSG